MTKLDGFIITAGIFVAVFFLGMSLVVYGVNLDNKLLRYKIKEHRSDQEYKNMIFSLRLRENNERIKSLQKEVGVHNVKIGIIEESLDPENTRWAKVKQVRSAVKTVIEEKGYTKVPNIKGLTSYAAAVVDFSEKYDVSIPLILAVTTRESAFNEKAKSPVGAQGLMQIMPATAKEISQDVDKRYYNIYKIRDNVRFGTWYIWKMMDRFNGDVESAIRAYNCGPTCVEKVQARLWSDYPKETIHYHEAVLKWKVYYEEMGL